MKLCKQLWFWLMLIFVSLIIVAFVLACVAFPRVRYLLNCEIFWVAFGSIATICSVIVALITYMRKNTIESRQKTYEAMYKLKDDVYKIERMIGGLTPEDIHRITQERMHKISNSSPNDIRVKCKKTRKKCYKTHDKWEMITKYLTKLEHFSTCVNNGIFDLETVKRMSGDYLKRQKTILEPVIDFKSRENDGRDTYKEFVKMIDSME